MNVSLGKTPSLIESVTESLTESLTESFTESFNYSSSILVGEELDYWEKALSGSRYTVQRILVPIVLIIGAFGNSITIAVMTRRHMQTSTNLYLTALAISDILYLFFMFSLSLSHTPGMSHKDHLAYWHYYRYGLWLTDASSNTSIWLTVTFTIERYIAVCHPMKGKVFCTQSRAKKVIIGVYLLCFLLTVTTPHEWDVQAKPDSNGTHLMLTLTDLGNHDTYRKVFYWFTAVTFILLPLVLLAAFNTFLILAVKRSRKQRTVMTGIQRDNSSHSTQENKITIMLIAVVLLALVCQLPTAAMLIYTSFHHAETNTIEYFVCRILNNFFNLLTAINAAVNFIFYCALSDRYRRTFLQTFCRKWYQKHSPTPSWMATTGYSNFEDGSPRTSFRSSLRGSSRRNSRRSSYRSSPTTTPRGSPNRSIRGLERRSTGGSFLRVPPRSLLSTQEEKKDTFALPQDSRVKDLDSSLDSNHQNYVLKQVFHNGNSNQNFKELLNSSNFSERRTSSEELLEKPLTISAESEIVPNVLKEIPKEHKTNFFRGLNFIRKEGEFIPLSRKHSIIIKCQKPSIEEQTPV